MIHNFARLRKKYGTEYFHITVTEGHHDYTQGGIWVPGVEVENMKFDPVIPLSNEDLNYSEGGTYKATDRKIYTPDVYEKGDKIKYKGDPFVIQERKDYTEYSDINIYVIRRADNA